MPGHRQLFCCALKSTNEREKVRVGERVDARRNYTASKVRMLYVVEKVLNCHTWGKWWFCNFGHFYVLGLMLCSHYNHPRLFLTPLYQVFELLFRYMVYMFCPCPCPWPRLLSSCYVFLWLNINNDTLFNVIDLQKSQWNTIYINTFCEYALYPVFYTNYTCPLVVVSFPPLRTNFWAPEWRRGLRHYISVLEASLQTPWFESSLYHNRPWLGVP